MWCALFSVLLFFLSVKYIKAGEELTVDLINKHPAWNLIPTDVCGTTRYQSNTARIVNGKDAKLGQFPWIAQLGYSAFLSKPSFDCAGTLITKKYVLTAGHCGTDHNLVRLGEHDTKTIVDCDADDICTKHLDIPIKKHVFNDFIHDTFTEDICLILLARAVEFNEFIKPACLPRGEILDMDFMGKHAQIAGWGYVNSTLHIVATTLQYISVPIVDSDKCNKIYRHELNDKQFCAGYPKGKDSCNGDSGGPMTKLIRTSDNKGCSYVLGIVSYGKSNCGEGPAVYTDVSKYMLHILDNITE